MLLGGVAGAMLMLIFVLGLLFWNGFSGAVFFSQENLIINWVMTLLSPIGGGFIAGLIGTSNPRRTGLLAGLAGGMVLCAIWLVFSGITWDAVISGLVVIFVWLFLAGIGAGFSPSR